MHAPSCGLVRQNDLVLLDCTVHELTTPRLKHSPPGQAATLYRQKLDNIMRYLDEMEVPKPVIDAMKTTGSADIRWVDDSAYGLERAPSFAEWVDASCGRISADEEKALLKLGARKSNLNTDEKLLLKILTEKSMAITGAKLICWPAIESGFLTLELSDRCLQVAVVDKRRRSGSPLDDD